MQCFQGKALPPFKIPQIHTQAQENDERWNLIAYACPNANGIGSTGILFFFGAITILLDPMVSAARFQYHYGVDP